uniref:Phorbol-ester/DAG-type domain-containing protein n=1 Tax=Ditylenchus dipsaci TaxID=166011 RepID=A0A915DP04_9BILA
MCKGKIWLKWASRCTTCNFVCHNKCVERANREHECVPDVRPMNFEDDAHFEVLDGAELGDQPHHFQPEIEERDLSTADTDSIATSNTTSRRRRIANKVSEKLTTTWRNVGAPRMRKLSKQTSPTTDVSTTISSDLDSARTAENSSSQGGQEVDGNELVSIVETLAKDFQI